MTNYRSKHSFGKRLDLSRIAMNTHVNRIPVILESKTPYSCKKILISSDMTLNSFIKNFTEKYFLGKNKTFIFMIDEDEKMNLVLPCRTFEELYECYKSQDNLLYINYFEENTFG